MTVLRPKSLAEALDALDQGARAVAGGTALQSQWAQGVPRPGVMLDLMPLLPAGISRDGSGIRIGAGTTLQSLAERSIPLISQAARAIAAPGVRRLGTVGGQIGWGQGCLLPVLLVLDTRLITTSGAVALKDWLARPEGVILELCLTPREGFFRKIGPRAGFTPAHLVVAGTHAPSRLALGGGPVPPQRLFHAESLIHADTPTEAIAKIIAANATLPDCPQRSAIWRGMVAGRVIADALSRAQEPQGLSTLAPGIETQRDRWHTRPDMAAKVTGQLEYLTDTRRPGMLIGRILRSAHPHARILGIDTTRARAAPGVRAVVTASDIPGLNAFGIVFPDQPALADDRVRYLGDAVAAVAAETEAQAEAALSLIEVRYQPLAVVDLDNAETSAALHGTTNLISTVGLTRGDMAAFATAAHVVTDTYTTPRQMHGFLETEGGHAELLPDGTLLISAGGQHGARDRMQLSRILNRPEATIRVITSPTGGAFGGKDELTVQPALALLALATGQPVRLHLSRAESLVAGTKRTPFRITMRTACDADGHLIAQEVQVLADAGAYASLSPGVLETAMEHAAGPYVIPNIQTQGRLYYTNNGTCGAFRGFGANQMAWAVECQIDRLAALAGLTPVEIRRRNLRRPGTPGFLGQRVAGSERLAEMLEAARTSPLWTPPEVGPEWHIGTGMALIWQGNGLGTVPTDQAEGQIRLAPDGAIEVLCGMDEMGQGLLAGLCATVAEALGVARADIRPVTGDTGATPDSGSTTASRGGYVMWKLAHAAAPGLGAQLLTGAAALLDLDPATLRLMPGGVGQNHGPLITFPDLAAALFPTGLPSQSVAFGFPKTEYTQGNARLIFCSGATVARVQVSRLTGEVRVLALDHHTAAGPVIDLASYLGQMEGGLVQGLGFTLSEDVLMAGGHYLTRNFDSYMMPSVRDVPVIRVSAQEDLDPGDPYGPRGAGELGIGGVTPAICNAVAQAVGFWPTVTPIAPEMILRQLK